MNLLKEIQVQNEILRRRDQERDERFQAASTAHIKKKQPKAQRRPESPEDLMPQLPKKRPIQINNMKMAEVFDPFQFVPRNNQSRLPD